MDISTPLPLLSDLRRPYLALLTRAEIMGRFTQMCRERSAFEAIRCILNNQAYEWIHSVGVCSDEHLGTLIPPLPPLELRSIVAASEPELFLWTGLIDITTLLAIYHYYHLASPRPRILDFGAGCGRMIRFLSDHADRYDPSACDVNLQHVIWCQQNLPGVRSFKNEVLPPFPVEDGSFDLVYSLSVFTHLPESAAQAWMQEIERILAPGGLVIFTTHGQRALETIRDSAVHQEMFLTTPEKIRSILANLSTERFVFLKYPSDVLESAGSGSEYGNSFIHPDYIQEHWSKRLQLVTHLPAGLRGWQDIVVMRRGIEA